MATVITTIAMPTLAAAYLATEFLFKPPIPTTTLLIIYHKLTTTNKTQRHQGTNQTHKTKPTKSR